MATLPISQLNGGVLLTNPASGDLIPVTDVSDTTESPDGTTKPMEMSEVIAEKVRESAGPTVLSVGAVADGEFLKRDGSAIVGETPSSGLTTEQVQDIVGAMIVGGTDIDATYDDGTGTVTIDNTGGGGGAGSVTVAHLGSDVANSTTTAAEITGLNTTLAPGTYVFQYYIRYQTDNTGTGIKFSVNFTGTQTCFMYNGRYTSQGTTAVSDFANQNINSANGNILQSWGRRAPATNAEMGPILNVDAANSDMMFVIDGLVIVTVSGDIELYSASDSAATSTVKTGTSLILTQIA